MAAGFLSIYALRRPFWVILEALEREQRGRGVECWVSSPALIEAVVIDAG
jgi:hypothetical protein